MTDPDPATTAVPNHVVVVGASAIAGMDSAEIGSVPRVRIARMVLEHAWPLIEAEARAAERQHIREWLDRLDYQNLVTMLDGGLDAG